MTKLVPYIHACPFAMSKIYAIKLKMLKKKNCLKNRKPHCNMSWCLCVRENHSHMRWLGNHIFCLPIAVLTLLQRLFQSCTLYISLKVHFLCFVSECFISGQLSRCFFILHLYMYSTIYSKKKSRKKDLNIATVIARQYKS